jgi:hypothetical protein
MAMGKKRARQQDFWIATGALPRSRGHIFYDRVNEILKGEDFDEFCGEGMRWFLQERDDRATEHRTGSVFSDADGRIFRRLSQSSFLTRKPFVRDFLRCEFGTEATGPPWCDSARACNSTL